MPTVTEKLKTTRSICPECLEPVEADVVLEDGAVWMHKTCTEHGAFSTLLASDARHYYDSSRATDGGGCGASSGCCGTPTGGSALSNHSCTVLIEICERCNLTCPTCFAGSSTAHSKMMSLSTFRDRVRGLEASGKGSADTIQLSGGEPTIHPLLPEMLEALYDAGFTNVTINSNGIKLAQATFVQQLGQRLAPHPSASLQIYLQFDGFDDETHARLRGRSDLLSLKHRAIENCLAAGFAVHPVMTLTRDINDHEVGRFVKLALKYPEIRHVVIQPAMYSGRYEHPKSIERLTLADTVDLLTDQFDVFGAEDFGPIPCADPNCHGIAVALRTEKGLVPISRYFPPHDIWSSVEVSSLVARVSDTLNGAQVFAEVVQWLTAKNEPGSPMQDIEPATVELLLDALTAESDGGSIWDHLLTISIKPFMDALSYDQDRIDRCCVHILDDAGVPVSLCEFNAITRPKRQMEASIDG